MRTPCEWTLKDFLPRVRSKIAKELYQSGKKQSEIAKLMGISQPRVFQYLNSDESLIIRNIDLPQLKLLQTQLEDVIERTAEDIVVELKLNRSAPETIPIICQSCRELRMGSALCTLHFIDYKELGDHIGEGQSCDLCLKWKKALPKDSYSIQSLEDRMSVIVTLENIANELLMKKSFLEYIPQIGAQICLIASVDPNKDHLRDVAAFPGRIIRYRSQAKIISRPEFYASESTANLLIKFRKKVSQIRGALSIKYSQKSSFKYNLESKGFQIIETSIGDTNKIPSEINREISPKIQKIAILDAGVVGFEPIAYLLVENPRSLLDVFV
ncbi:MAG: thiamine-phosphate synthase family protein [Candidatus Hodarchaeales archaeon]|jgi:predicted fused transcriptional regulator/phosphomethylpyrimidine kinase/predicted transcriptional regulator